MTNRQVISLPRAFANNSSKVIKLSKTKICKIIQSEGVFGRPLGPSLKFGLSLMKNVLNLLTSVLIPLGLIAAASAADAEIQKEIKTSNIKQRDERHYENC